MKYFNRAPLAIRAIFNITLKKVGGIRFLRIGNLSVSWSISAKGGEEAMAKLIREQLASEYAKANHFGPWTDENGSII